MTERGNFAGLTVLIGAVLYTTSNSWPTVIVVAFAAGVVSALVSIYGDKP